MSGYGREERQQHYEDSKKDNGLYPSSPTTFSGVPVTVRIIYKQHLLQEAVRWKPSKSVDGFNMLIHYSDDDDDDINLHPKDSSIQRRRYESYGRDRILMIEHHIHIYGT